jgi:hypothetical protein
MNFKNTLFKYVHIQISLRLNRKSYCSVILFKINNSYLYMCLQRSTFVYALIVHFQSTTSRHCLWRKIFWGAKWQVILNFEIRYLICGYISYESVHICILCVTYVYSYIFRTQKCRKEIRLSTYVHYICSKAYTIRYWGCKFCVGAYPKMHPNLEHYWNPLKQLGRGLLMLHTRIRLWASSRACRCKSLDNYMLINCRSARLELIPTCFIHKHGARDPDRIASDIHSS